MEFFKNMNSGEGRRKGNLPAIVSGNVHWCSHYGEQCGRVFCCVCVFSCQVMSDSLRPHGLHTSGFFVLHCLQEFAQIHVCLVSNAI